MSILIQKTATSKNSDISKFCDEISSEFRKLFDRADVSYTDFIRTTENRHRLAVEKFWNVLESRGFIYKSKYEGYYSLNDEAFVPENMITVNDLGEKISSATGHTLHWHEEENYIFRLSVMKDRLIDWIENQVEIKPKNFHTALQADFRNWDTLNDISISRCRSRLSWGIPTPNDNRQLVYVWFDALTNYLTAAGYPNELKLWPPCHVIGKDIIKFHCIYWPAFLMAADLEPPKLIYCHSHWLYDHKKMSKSLGNVIDPFDCIEKFTSDGIRYFLLKEGTPHSDSNFSIDSVRNVLNSDLADNLGNLINRSTSIKLNPSQIFPHFPIETIIKFLPECCEIIESSRLMSSKCLEAYLDGNFYIGINEIMNTLRKINALYNQIEPWKLTSDLGRNRERLESLLYISLELIRVTAILLEPIVPNISKSIHEKLNIDEDLRTWKSTENIFGSDFDQRSRRACAKVSAKKLFVFSKI
ncbi:methionine-tRNA ligase, mitochondrial-like protein [Sarcoptes scabiei]|uniref:Methionine--tRNA ligase, mitochondrial n=1 Tax=Sarcoptes scabiei TaxID=52283 RepID=A0A132AEA7_SARSC|nr:methionine-tRNA ligase, mitochondrial-like protein [Sarcoptes scabiei]